MKDTRSLVCGSPLVMIQIALIVWFALSAAFEACEQWGIIAAVIYMLLMTFVYFLAMVSLLMTFMTHPGQVNKFVIEKLKNQLLTPRQLDRMMDILDLKTRTHYQLKCFNRAILRHIQMTHE